MSFISDPQQAELDGIYKELNKYSREEREFQLIVNMHVSPSEAEKLSDNKLNWLLARFLIEMERQQQMMARQQQDMMAQQILASPDIRNKLKI